MVAIANESMIDLDEISNLNACFYSQHRIYRQSFTKVIGYTTQSDLSVH